MTLKLAFIGTGQIAGWHLRGIAGLTEHLRGAEPPFALVALADPRAEAREALAVEVERMLGRRPTLYGDYRVMLERESLDVASLLVPHNVHWSIARDCLDAGLHLQVQKPIALTIADGRRIIDYAQAKGRALVVSEPSVLGRNTRALFAALHADGLVGTPTMLLDYAVTTLNGGFSSIRLHVHDEAVHTVEQGTTVCVDGVDVGSHVIRHQGALRWLAFGRV